MVLSCPDPRHRRGVIVGTTCRERRAIRPTATCLGGECPFVRQSKELDRSGDIIMPPQFEGDPAAVRQDVVRRHDRIDVDDLRQSATPQLEALLIHQLSRALRPTGT